MKSLYIYIYIVPTILTIHFWNSKGGITSHLAGRVVLSAAPLWVGHVGLGVKTTPGCCSFFPRRKSGNIGYMTHHRHSSKSEMLCILPEMFTWDDRYS